MCNLILKCSLLIPVVVLVTGCVAPEARKGAELLASFTHQISEENTDYVQSRTALAQARQANIAMLEANATELENAISRDIAVWELSGVDGKRRAELMRGIQKFANDTAAQSAALADLRKKHEASISSAKSAVELRQKEFSTVAKALTTLSQNPDLQSEIKFFTGYFKEVKKGIKEAKAAAAESTKAAEVTIKSVIPMDNPDYIKGASKNSKF